MFVLIFRKMFVLLIICGALGGVTACSQKETEEEHLATPAAEEESSATPAAEEESSATPVAEEEPLATPVAEEESVATPGAEGLIINEDVTRLATFRLNMLAYKYDGTEDVEVLNITYGHHNGTPLTLDIFYPEDLGEDARPPVVILGMGYRMSEMALRNAFAYTSWGRLLAASGMAAIAYDTEQPDQDLETLMAFVRDNAAGLGIDPDRIGFLSMSANTATVMSYLMQEGRDPIRFSVYLYGLTLTPDRKYTDLLDEVCAGRGCLVADLADVTYVDPELPLLVVKAGQDAIPNLNEAMDYFVDYAEKAGAPLTLIEYKSGMHGFDTEQQTRQSAATIAQTVEFMKSNFGLE